MSANKLDYLKALEIDVWVPRDAAVVYEKDTHVVTEQLTDNRAVAALTDATATQRPVTQHPVTQPTDVQSGSSSAVKAENAESVAYGVATYDWSRLKQAVVECTLCELAQSRTQAVFGTGDQQADLMIIGEAPGADEDKQGEPFVGKAGQLLSAMLNAIGLARRDVYIANILKCRPPNNRDPRAEEAALCASYLQRQIALVQPKLILALGRIAAQHLLDSSTTLGRMRGQIYHLEAHNTPVMVTYHPAYLLRSPAEKAKSWQDLKACKRFINAARQSGSAQ